MSNKLDPVKAIQALKDKHPQLDFSESVFKGTKQIIYYKCKNESHGVQKSEYKALLRLLKDCPLCSKERREKLLYAESFNRVSSEFLKHNLFLTSIKDDKYFFDCSQHGSRSISFTKYYIDKKDNNSHCFDCFETKRKQLNFNKVLKKYNNKLIKKHPSLQIIACPLKSTLFTDTLFVFYDSIGDVTFEDFFYSVFNRKYRNSEEASQKAALNPKIALQRLSKKHPHLHFIEYRRVREKIKFYCPDHGEKNNYYSVILKSPYGCTECTKESRISAPHKDLNLFLDNLNIEYFINYRPKWLKRHEVDIYIPSLNLAIEFNGFVYHHSSKGVSDFLDNTCKDSDYHLKKYELCKQNNVDLIFIYDFECLDTWKKNLTSLFQNFQNYKITFTNQKRIIKNLEVFGCSIITPIF